MDSSVNEREREMKLVSLKTIRGLLRYDIKIRNDTLDWWHQKEKLCTSKISSLVEKLCLTVMLVRKTAVLMIMNSFVMVREILIEDYQRPALIWHQDQNRHTWSVSPGLLLMMTSRIETLHSGHLHLSRETLSACHVSQKTAVLMMMDSSVNERETWSLLHWRCSESCFDMTTRSETTHWTRVSRLATDDAIKKKNSIYRLVRKLCSTVMLVVKLMC